MRTPTREIPGRDAMTDILDGLTVLRPYAASLWTTDERLGVRLRDEAVLRDIDVAILRMAGWSYVEALDGARQAWVYD
jgi:hypothetical protein